MNVVALEGKSGVGKTTIANALVEKYPDKYHIIHSYTTRPKRYDNELGHEFISDDEMDSILASDRVMAQCVYGDYRYCSSTDQFIDDPDVYNLYVVDKRGIYDLRQYQKQKYFFLLCIQIQRTYVDIDYKRLNREQEVKYNYIKPDYVVSNDLDIDDAVEHINMIV